MGKGPLIILFEAKKNLGINKISSICPKIHLYSQKFNKTNFHIRLHRNLYILYNTTKTKSIRTSAPKSLHTFSVHPNHLFYIEV